MTFSAAAACLAVAAMLSAAPSDRPTLSLENLEGRPRDLAGHAGRIVVLNFWATWCPPCREEMPLLDDLQKRYAGQGVVFIGASTDDAGTRGNIQPFLEEHGITIRIWTGATVQDMERFGLSTALPATAILDRDGQVAFRLIGPLKREQLVGRLDYLLSGLRGPAPEPLVNLASESSAPHQEEGRHHEHGDEHAHGQVDGEDASSVPS